jgi:hypothetical protein
MIISISPDIFLHNYQNKNYPLNQSGHIITDSLPFFGSHLGQLMAELPKGYLWQAIYFFFCDTKRSLFNIGTPLHPECFEL